MIRTVVSIGIMTFSMLVFVSCSFRTSTDIQEVPFEYFQGLKKENERFVLFAPKLASYQYDSYLYIITNPEDIDNAYDTDVGKNTHNYSVNDINKSLNDLSPVVIRSTTQSPYGNGMAIFTIPEDVEGFFYAYFIHENFDEKYPDNIKTVIGIGYELIPHDSDYIFSGFSESNDDDLYSATTSYTELKSIYEKTNGSYGYYLSKNKKQIGFNEVNLNRRK